MTTILEALQNAEFNINSGNSMSSIIGNMQLHNAITLLEKGYSIHDEIDNLLEEWGDVENVPDKS